MSGLAWLGPDDARDQDLDSVPGSSSREPRLPLFVWGGQASIIRQDTASVHTSGYVTLASVPPAAQARLRLHSTDGEMATTPRGETWPSPSLSKR